MHFQEAGRTIILRGVNLADGKFPYEQPSYHLEFLASEIASECTYVDTPLKLEDAPHHLHKLRYLGFNVLRVPVVWEALEHSGPGIYDEKYIEHVVKLAQLCNEHGFKVIINPHQDLWSRFAGGSGAPLWTLHACGLDPAYFGETHASVRYADWPMDSETKDPKSIPNMMWTTNHNRLAACTLFSLFFGGRDFAPKCQIDGLSIQEYLQKHYFAAYAKLAERLGDLPYAYDSMNEPEAGYIGWNDLNKNERDNTAKIGSTPTPIQSMRLGMGLAQTVDEYRLGQTGPHKTGTIEIKPKHSCWLKQEDPRWKWKRADSWPLNTCVWALNGVWDVTTGELKKANYFDDLPEMSDAATRAENKVGGPLSFISSYWQEFHQRWSQTMRKYSPNAIMFIQPSVFSPPPPRDEPLIAYSPHFYDGLTIMRKHWHERWNADVVGLLRGNYGSKMFGLRVGKGNVRKVISAQIGELAHDVKLPTLIGETGIPFNLDDDKAYRDGDYSSQVKALDTILGGCDDHLLSFTVWAYSAINTQKWGDHWNGEDLSLYCAETGSFPNHPFLRGARAPAAWCRPYAESLTGEPKSMSFDVSTGKFELEIESKEPGYAVVYVPWLHYKKSDDPEEVDLDVKISEGDWSVKGQYLRWDYMKGGKLKLSRAGGALSPEQLGTIVK
ncbi:Uu.00g041690.m01.CDS01 [Anthostomella pinea]|uniref:Uu.00g041690.m01.CDS01 n=1 Tax=Anthostomella pinea TaxID=933095 RepID=A0AAI8YDY7_9PEZI|nr:Uu.00g041690.m01.CDS01 [Anthostomella pinea]